MLKSDVVVSEATGGDADTSLSAAGVDVSLEVGADEEAKDVVTRVELAELVEAVAETDSVVEFMESTLIPEMSILNPRFSLQHAFESSTPLRRYPQQ